MLLVTPIVAMMEMKILVLQIRIGNWFDMLIRHQVTVSHSTKQVQKMNLFLKQIYLQMSRQGFFTSYVGTIKWSAWTRLVMEIVWFWGILSKFNLRASVKNPKKCPNKAKQTIKLCKLQCSIPHYKDWSQRMSLEALCPSCANYQYQATELRKRFKRTASVYIDN